MRRSYVYALTSLLAVAGFFAVSCRVATVRVIDGDTFVARILDRDGLPSRYETTVRVIGIDTPETQHPSQPEQCYGSQATARARQLLDGAVVDLVGDEEHTDGLARWLNHVFVGGEWLGVILVREGLAIVDTHPPNLRLFDELVAAQREAKAARRGLWGDCFRSRSTSVIVAYIFQRQDLDGGATVRDEWVELGNISGQVVNMSNWWLVSEKGDQWFRFPEATTLQPGQSCRVYSHEVRDDSCTDRAFGGGWVWNDTGDYATLWDGLGRLVDEYAYGDCRPSLTRAIPC